MYNYLSSVACKIKSRQEKLASPKLSENENIKKNQKMQSRLERNISKLYKGGRREKFVR